MSFNTIATISAIVEVIVILAIVLTLFNAFSDGLLSKLSAKVAQAVSAKLPRRAKEQIAAVRVQRVNAVDDMRRAA